MSTILVVDDDPTTAELVEATLTKEGLAVTRMPDGLAALKWLEDHQPNLIIADIMMPRMNGYQLFERVRRNPDWVWIPFIFLSGRDATEDIRYGKELGADDYLTKPFEPGDLLAAVWGKLARYEHLVASAGVQVKRKLAGQYEVGTLVVDFSRREVIAQGEQVLLSPTEFEILHRLVAANGAVVDYGELLNDDVRDSVDERDAAELLRYHIRNLRRKLEDTGESKETIANVRSVGYRLVESPRRLD